jgi:hypothetical protein
MRPICGRQYQDRKAAVGQVLLKAKVAIGRDEQIELLRSAVVEKNTHAAGSACLCCLNALRRVLENRLRLPAGYPGEPFQKLVEGCAAFQILE